MSTKSITPEEITLLSKYVADITGIKLDPEKGYLLESRFQHLISDYNLNNYEELYRKAVNDRTGAVTNQIIDAITTNETYFFRDIKPFELMTNKIIPELIDRRRESSSNRIPLKIWSAACSTGQEIYSIGITLLEMLKPIERYQISILGTDISDDVVAKASYGQYNRFEVERGLPPHYLNKYFTKTANGWRIKDIVRTMARFEKRDLNKPFAELGKFDLIFCRNVAIYFDHPDKIRLFSKLAQSLAPGGSLIVGSSESLSGISDLFVAKHYLKSIYYQLADETPVSRPTRPSPDTRSIPSQAPPRQTTQINRPTQKVVHPFTPIPSVSRVRAYNGQTTEGIAATRADRNIASPEPEPAAKKRKPVSTVAQKAAATKPAKVSGGSLVSNIQKGDHQKKSLLSSVAERSRQSKKSLLKDIRGFNRKRQLTE